LQREDGLDLVANGCRRKAIKEDAGGKFIKAKGEEK
jgi:hypothetical protein